MNMNEINDNNLEVSYQEQSNDEYAPKKFKTRDILIFVVCLALAFICWAYAHYIDDPVIEAKIPLNFVLENAENGEYISNVSFENIIVHAEESLIGNITHIDVIVDSNLFDSYGTPVTVTITLPDGVHSHTKEVEVTINSTTPN